MFDKEDKLLLVKRAAISCTLAAFFAATPTSASCAWVLWSQAIVTAAAGGPRISWARISAHSTGEACQAAAAAEPGRVKAFHEKLNLPPLPVPERYVCWPDTVDPSRPPAAP